MTKTIESPDITLLDWIPYTVEGVTYDGYYTVTGFVWHSPNETMNPNKKLMIDGEAYELYGNTFPYHDMPMIQGLITDEVTHFPIFRRIEEDDDRS